MCNYVNSPQCLNLDFAHLLVLFLIATAVVQFCEVPKYTVSEKGIVSVKVLYD